MAIKILPSITTTNQDITTIQVEELKTLNLQEAGLFITGLQTPQERMEFMRHVKKELPNIKFPLVHIRSDSVAEEAKFCLDQFQTKWMNIHGNHYKKFPTTEIFRYKDYIIAENSKDLKTKQMKNFAGICLDLSHYYEDLSNDEEWVDRVTETTQDYNIYCNHISAVKKKDKFCKHFPNRKIGEDVWTEHIGNYNSDFDYLAELSQMFFGSCCSCLELENTINTQLKFKEYIENKLCLPIKT